MAYSPNKIEIVNWKEIDLKFKQLDITQNKKSQAKIRTAMKKPFRAIRKNAVKDLKTMMASSPVSKGNLARGLSVGSKFSKKTGYFTVAFGGRSRAINEGKPMRKGHPNRSPNKKRNPVNHFHLVNSGTRLRYHNKNFKSTGAVGKGKSYNNPRTNPNFKTGFADRNIVAEIPKMSTSLYNGLKDVYDEITKK